LTALSTIHTSPRSDVSTRAPLDVTGSPKASTPKTTTTKTKTTAKEVKDNKTKQLKSKENRNEYRLDATELASQLLGDVKQYSVSSLIMRSDKLKPREDSVTALEHLVNKKQYEKAYSLFEDLMMKRSKDNNSLSVVNYSTRKLFKYGIVAAWHSERGDPREVLHVMKRSGIELNAVGYSVMLQYYRSKLPQFQDEAFELCDRFLTLASSSSSPPLSPASSSDHSPSNDASIKLNARNQLPKQLQLDARLLGNVIKLLLGLDEDHNNDKIRDMLIDTIRLSRSLGEALDLNTYNRLVDYWAKRDNLSMVQSVLREMDEKGIKPDVVTCNSAMNQWAKKLYEDNVNAVLTFMKQSNIQYSVTTYNVLIDMYAKRGKFSEVDRLWEEMLASPETMPDEGTCTIVLAASVKRERADQVEMVRNYTKKRGIALNMLMYNSLLAWAIKQKNIQV